MSAVKQAASKSRGLSFLLDSEYSRVDWDTLTSERVNSSAPSRSSPCPASPESEP